MGDDTLNEVVKKGEALALEKAEGLLKRWGIPPKVVVAVLTVIMAVVGGVGTAHLRAQGNREEYPALAEEVRDAERIRAQGNQLEEQYKSAKASIQAQAQALVQRAATRLGKKDLGYDPEKLVWFVPDGIAAPASASTAAVTTAK